MSKKKILVVDDEQDMLFAVRLQLEAHSYEVITASDGQEGLTKAREEFPDLIILDLMLPKLDGYRVCRMLKFDEKYKKIPIIMFTACNQEEDQKLGFEVGADDYQMKPFEPKILLEKISNLLTSADS